MLKCTFNRKWITNRVWKSDEPEEYYICSLLSSWRLRSKMVHKYHIDPDYWETGKSAWRERRNLQLKPHLNKIQILYIPKYNTCHYQLINPIYIQSHIFNPIYINPTTAHDLRLTSPRTPIGGRKPRPGLDGTEDLRATLEDEEELRISFPEVEEERTNPLIARHFSADCGISLQLLYW